MIVICTKAGGCLLAKCARHREMTKKIMAISHPPCLHAWFIVKCSMGGPPEAKCRLHDAGVFCSTSALGGLPSTNLST